MSSVNPYYTFRYSQPEVYRFSHDSVFLARRVFEILRAEIKSDWKVLDLCAGCGIVGMDFLFHCKSEGRALPGGMDFLEIQDEYETHFEINKGRLQIPEVPVRFLRQNYTEALADEYDLILCNPPYFVPEQGQLSPHHFKNRCRFFMDASHADLVRAVERALSPKGKAYVLTRVQHPPTASLLTAREVGEIRGTPLICYERCR